MRTILECDNAIICTNIVVAMEDFIVSSRINYTCIALSQSKFVLSNSSITVNLSKCVKILCFLCIDKKVSHSSFYKNE